MVLKDDRLLLRFWSKVDKAGDCWEWLGAKALGYAVFKVNGRMFKAHRLSYEFTHGAIVPEMRVLHRCDNRACVRPNHLFLGTQADAVANMDRKGRRAKGKPVELRFWRRVQKTETCWLWTACKRAGYGHLWDGGKVRSAHRISYELAYGAIPQGMHVLHKCDVPACVRPDHLFLGTDLDNSQDKWAKGRGAKGEMAARRGAHNGNAQLTVDDVRVIRESTEYQKVIAQRFGITQQHVSAIKRGRRWSYMAEQCQ